MPRMLVKIKDKYFEWSTVVDAPVTFGMTKEELSDYIKEEYGRQGMRDLEKRLERVDENGTSVIPPCTLSDIIKSNRAGPDESELTEEEIYIAYGLQKSIRDNWTAA